MNNSQVTRKHPLNIQIFLPVIIFLLTFSVKIKNFKCINKLQDLKYLKVLSYIMLLIQIFN